ncbi:NPCBM/NEW2 domain-containing protein [Peptoclostridium litorale DSM 5388]|uniref:Uncharacterized protein n=1 Tax=Peptoclostridium litorale DSM 5388 TaxID=1121324 RepID=A0A069RD09_PEPLI|nr:NPCBM/NEW2 domain-containing protein [Peptoclostridium litorale]KDR94959.1 hypothetical protein CLIT_12c00270 [Peptoclostridium litorale DSM 5388]SIO33791.1 NPCBM/NEW2 domain-containing protein [Peptoclostridium litorale DSM 5388]
MKRKSYVFAILIAIFLQGTFSYAYPKSFSDVALDKDWTIEFTTPVDETTLTPENIGILDFNSNRIAADVEIDSADHSRVRIKPVNPYMPKKDYIIYANTDIVAENGICLDKGISVTFKTNDVPFYISKTEPIDKEEHIKEGLYKYEILTLDKVADNTGYEHTNAIGAKFTNESSDIAYPAKNKVYVDYYLGGEYSLFSGKLVINGENRFMEGEGYVKIYADENLVYSNEEIKAGLMPQELSVDVSGASKLRIEFGVSPQEVGQGTFFEAYIGSAGLKR